MSQNIQSLLQVIPKDTFYNSKKDVINSSTEMHNEIFKRDRELYTYLLYFNNSTYYSKSKIITTLLGNSLYAEDEKTKNNLIAYEDALIHYALFNESITHAIKMLLELKEKRINNSRTTNIILDFIFNRGNADFIAIKYRNKLKDLLIHALGLNTINKILSNTADGKKLFKKHIDKYNNPYAKEIFTFICGKTTDVNFECKSEYITEYIRVAKEFSSDNFNVKNIKGTKLPVEVLMGFNNFYKKNLNLAAIMVLGNSSSKQKIQMQNAVKKATNNTVELKIDFEQYSIIELYKYLYNKIDITSEELEEIWFNIENKATELAMNNRDIDLGKIAILLDLSGSSSGSIENPNAPLFRELLVEKVYSYLNASSKTYTIGGYYDSERRIYLPESDTNFNETLVKIAQDGYAKVLVLSDGFENSGCFEMVYEKIREFIPNFNIIHYNPVFSPKDFSCKKLSDSITTIPFKDIEDIKNARLFVLLDTDENAFKIAIKTIIDKTILNKEEK